jgi:hypothetical protein
MKAKIHRNDQFPTLDLPDFDSTEVSSDDESQGRLLLKEAKYTSKIDEDVAMFTQIAERLSVASLLHLLQGHVRSTMGMMEYETVLKMSEINTSLQALRRQQNSTPKVKKFRFAEVMGGSNVRCIVHEIKPYKKYIDLWWSDGEMEQMRANAIDAVKFFRKQRPKYVQAVECLLSDTKVKHVLESALKVIIKDSYPRGLEAHILKKCTIIRTEACSAVLTEQEKTHLRGQSYGKAAENMRQRSLDETHSCVVFARRIAKCDEIEAMKALSGKWEPEMD